MNILNFNMSNYLNEKIDKKGYNAAISSFYENMSNSMYTSFLRQREVISSRIPAQTL
jgi:hypothetical protein